MGYRNRAKQLDDPVPVMPQRYTWKPVASYATYEAARAVMAGKNSSRRLKIKRRGDRFELRMGTPLKE